MLHGMFLGLGGSGTLLAYYLQLMIEAAGVVASDVRDLSILCFDTDDDRKRLPRVKAPPRRFILPPFNGDRFDEELQMKDPVFKEWRHGYSGAAGGRKKIGLVAGGTGARPYIGRLSLRRACEDTKGREFFHEVERRYTMMRELRAGLEQLSLATRPLIVVAASVVGGQGIGAFIDMGVFLRDLISYHEDAIIVGVLLLPSFYDPVGDSRDLRRNAEASLRGVNFAQWPNRTFLIGPDEPVGLNMSLGDRTIRLAPSVKPYDFIILQGGLDANGGALPSPEAAFGTAAESLRLLLVDAEMSPAIRSGLVDHLASQDDVPHPSPRNVRKTRIVYPHNFAMLGSGFIRFEREAVRRQMSRALLRQGLANLVGQGGGASPSTPPSSFSRREGDLTLRLPTPPAPALQACVSSAQAHAALEVDVRRARATIEAERKKADLLGAHRREAAAWLAELRTWILQADIQAAAQAMAGFERHYSEAASRLRAEQEKAARERGEAEAALSEAVGALALALSARLGRERKVAAARKGVARAWSDRWQKELRLFATQDLEALLGSLLKGVKALERTLAGEAAQLLKDAAAQAQQSLDDEAKADSASVPAPGHLQVLSKPSLVERWLREEMEDAKTAGAFQGLSATLRTEALQLAIDGRERGAITTPGQKAQFAATLLERLRERCHAFLDQHILAGMDIAEALRKEAALEGVADPDARVAEYMGKLGAASATMLQVDAAAAGLPAPNMEKVRVACRADTWRKLRDYFPRAGLEDEPLSGPNFVTVTSESVDEIKVLRFRGGLGLYAAREPMDPRFKGAERADIPRAGDLPLEALFSDGRHSDGSIPQLRPIRREDIELGLRATRIFLLAESLGLIQPENGTGRFTHDGKPVALSADGQPVAGRRQVLEHFTGSAQEAEVEARVRALWDRFSEKERLRTLQDLKQGLATRAASEVNGDQDLAALFEEHKDQSARVLSHVTGRSGPDALGFDAILDA